MTRNVKGGITAFLSVVLLLVLALIGTVLESGRVNTAKTYIDRMLITSMDSILAEFYYPLYKEYHLFLLDTGYGSGTVNYERITNQMKEYMNSTLIPESGVKLLGKMKVLNTDLYDIKIKNISIDEAVSITDFEGRLLIHEATAYMKYKTPAEMFEKIISIFSRVKESEESSEMIKKKLALEESAAELCEEQMNLIRQVEGISVNKKGIHYRQDGLIQTEDNFVKRICASSASQDSVGISHNLVWNSLKNHYENPVSWLDLLKVQSEKLQEYYIILKGLREELEELKGEDPKDTAIIRSEIYKKIQKVGVQQELSEKLIEDHVQRIVKLVTGTKRKITEALESIAKLELKQKNAERQINEYKQEIKENKENISNELYESLTTDINRSTQYINFQEENSENTVSTLSLSEMKKVLEYNKILLTTAEKIKQLKISGEESAAKKLKEAISDSKEAMTAYQIKNLTFDYSSLKTEKAKHPIDNFKQLLTNGELALVVDNSNDISERIINTNYLPSNVLEDENAEKNFSEDIIRCEDGYQKEITEKFGSGSEKEKEDQEVSKDTLIEKILFDEYLTEHFKNYGNINSKTGTKKIEQNTVLEYEQEYLVCGKQDDKKNMQDIVFRLALVRSILNYIYLISDQEKSGLAYAAAASIVGFTGMEPLISLTKTVILLVWAYEEALIDIRGLLDGNYIPFYKTKKSFMLKFEELFQISEGLIKEKAKKFEAEKTRPDDMNYNDYIKNLLFMTETKIKTMRTLDLIQENIKYNYNKNFKINECIFGYKINADFMIGAKFIRLPFVNAVLGSDTKDYPYHGKKEYTY